MFHRIQTCKIRISRNRGRLTVLCGGGCDMLVVDERWCSYLSQDVVTDHLLTTHDVVGLACRMCSVEFKHVILILINGILLVIVLGGSGCDMLVIDARWCPHLCTRCGLSLIHI